MPEYSKYCVEEECKVQDGLMTVRIRIVQYRPLVRYDDILDSAIRRRFGVYQKWLLELKKSGILEKGSDVDVPTKCFQSRSSDPEHDYEFYFKEQELTRHHLLKDVWMLARRLVTFLINGQTTEQQHSKVMMEESNAKKIRLIEIN